MTDTMNNNTMPPTAGEYVDDWGGDLAELGLSKLMDGDLCETELNEITGVTWSEEFMVSQVPNSQSNNNNNNNNNTASFTNPTPTLVSQESSSSASGGSSVDSSVKQTVPIAPAFRAPQLFGRAVNLPLCPAPLPVRGSVPMPKRGAKKAGAVTTTAGTSPTKSNQQQPQQLTVPMHQVHQHHHYPLATTETKANTNTKVDSSVAPRRAASFSIKMNGPNPTPIPIQSHSSSVVTTNQKREPFVFPRSTPHPPAPAPIHQKQKELLPYPAPSSAQSSSSSSSLQVSLAMASVPSTNTNHPTEPVLNAPAPVAPLLLARKLSPIALATAALSLSSSALPPLAPAPAPTVVTTSTTTKQVRGKKRKSAATTTATTTEDTAANTDANQRERNKEHARNTRLRKKAYIDTLKATLTDMVDQRDAKLQQANIQTKIRAQHKQVRKQVLQTFLDMRGSISSEIRGGDGPEGFVRWATFLEDGFALSRPSSTSVGQVVVSSVSDAMNDPNEATLFLSNLSTLSSSALSSSSSHVGFTYTCDPDSFLMDDCTCVLQWTGTTHDARSRLGLPSEIRMNGTLKAKFNEKTNKVVSATLLCDTGAIRHQFLGL